jgi:hypothetical protein
MMGLAAAAQKVEFQSIAEFFPLQRFLSSLWARKFIE